jgi:hypothetical protein
MQYLQKGRKRLGISYHQWFYSVEIQKATFVKATITDLILHWSHLHFLMSCLKCLETLILLDNGGIISPQQSKHLLS